MDSLDDIAESWKPELNRFVEDSRNHHLYS